MHNTAFQDAYPDDLSHCYGCGSNNLQGHQIKSYWLSDSDNNEATKTRAVFTPKPEHTAIPGFVYGGLIASLIDCHGTASASAMAYKQENRQLGSSPSLRFVTAKLDIDYLAPTPLGPELELIGEFVEVKERKIVVKISLYAQGKICAQGVVIAVKMPASMGLQS